MPNPQAVHIARADSSWRLRWHENDEDLDSHDLGEAIDAASSLASGGEAVRIVFHQGPAESDKDVVNTSATPS